MKHNRLIGIILLSLIIIIAVGYYYYSMTAVANSANPRQEADNSTIQQSVVRTGDLTVSVSGAGELVPASTAELSFQESGELVELNMRAGDQVQAGDILARLKIDKTPAQLAADIASAQLEVVRAQQNLDQLYNNAQIETAQALATVEEAQRALDDLTDFTMEIALAQQAIYEDEEIIQDIEMQLYILNSSPSQDAFDIAYSSLLFKEKELKEIQDQIAKIENKIKTAPNKTVRDSLKRQLLQIQLQLAYQQIEVDKTLYKYNSLDDPPEAIDLSVAEAQLAAAQAQLAQSEKDLVDIHAGPKSSDIALAEAELSEAQSEWDRLKDGPDPDKVTLAEAQLSQAKAKLASIEQGKLVLDLVAPINGTVLSTGATVGDRITNQSILTLADMSQPEVEVYLDETDLQQIQVGYRAEVVFDALPEVTFSGQIVGVDPSLQEAGNTTAVQALVQLDTLPNQFFSLPVGLNATIDIIAGQATNAILVPIEALQVQTDNSYFVYVLDGETVEQRPVQVGLVDVTTAEILTGLRAGERVAIDNVNIDQE